MDVGLAVKGMDVMMMICIACVIIMPVIIIRLAKSIKKVQDMKREAAGGGGEKKLDADK